MPAPILLSGEAFAHRSIGSLSLRHPEQVARQRSLLEPFDLDDLVAAREPLDCLGAEEVDYESAGLVEALAVVDAPAEVRVVGRARGVDAEATGPQDAQDLLRERV